jgi:hypothetical protein
MTTEEKVKEIEKLLQSIQDQIQLMLYELNPPEQVDFESF